MYKTTVVEEFDDKNQVIVQHYTRTWDITLPIAQLQNQIADAQNKVAELQGIIEATTTQIETAVALPAVKTPPVATPL